MKLGKVMSSNLYILICLCVRARLMCLETYYHYRNFPNICRPFSHRKIIWNSSGRLIFGIRYIIRNFHENYRNDDDEDEDSHVRQMMLGRQTACMCVSVDSSHENCSYHIQKYSCKFNGIQRPFLFYMNLQVALGGGGGRLIFEVDLYSRSTYIRESTVDRIG